MKLWNDSLTEVRELDFATSSLTPANYVTDALMRGARWRRQSR